ncbi:MAG: hypothetical protein KC620_20090, partial [Myxococcales bacterium]|nr:hypothetical protein [Myxococcales bacterium]
VSAPSTLDVMIDGLTDNAETHHVAQALGAWPEVAGVTIVESFIQGPTPRSTIRLTVQKLAASTLAARIEAARGLGLRVESHTLRRVFARFDPALRVQLALRVERLKNGTGEKAEDAMLAPLTKVLATALGGLPAVVVADSAAPFTVRGTLRYVGAADAAIELSLQTPDGAVLAETRLVGPGMHFSRTVRKAAADLQAQGLAKVLGDKNLRILAGIPLALPMPTAVASRIERFEPQPATVGAPMQIEVVLRSLDAPLDDALLEVRDAAGTLWASQRVPQVPADMPLTIPLAGPSAATPGAIEVTATLRARRDGRWLTEHRSAVVVVRPEAIARWSGAPP